MPDSIGQYSPEQVSDLIEHNLVDVSTALGKTQDSVVYRGTDVTWVYTGGPALSRVLRAKFLPDHADDRVTEILGYFRRWDAPVAWVVGPASWPPKLGDHLHHNGFGPSESWTGMAADLSKLKPLTARPEGLRIATAGDDASLRVWAELSTITPHGGDQNAGLFSLDNAGGDRRCKYFIAYQSKQPVARCMTFSNGPALGIYWLETITSMRHKGFASALVHHAIEQTRTAEHTVAVLAASSRAFSLFTKLGFQPYCQFHVYTWPPAPAKAATLNH